MHVKNFVTFATPGATITTWLPNASEKPGLSETSKLSTNTNLLRILLAQAYVTGGVELGPDLELLGLN